MKKSTMCILFDNVLKEYQDHYGKKSETQLIADLKQYLPNLSKDSEIILITNNTLEITKWLLKNDLYYFIKDVVKPRIS